VHVCTCCFRCRKTIVVTQFRVRRCSDDKLVGETSQLRIPGMSHWLALRSTCPFPVVNVIPLRGRDADDDLPPALDILHHLPDQDFVETQLPRAPEGYKLQLVNIFWTTVEEARAIARSPWRLLLDATCKTNRRNVPFVYIAGVDANDVTPCFPFALYRTYTHLLSCCARSKRTSGDPR
jgi:hypothetical protein